MKNGEGKQKAHSKVYNLIEGIMALLLAMPMCAVISVKEFLKNKKWKKGSSSTVKQDPDEPSLMHYVEPQTLGEDTEFISRIDEIVCFQYKSFNELSGKERSYQFIAYEAPELKEYLLKFFKEHPIEELLYGDIDCNGCDMDHWEIRLIFEDQKLNHRIRGYGIANASAPFLCDLIPYLFYKRTVDTQ